MLGWESGRNHHQTPGAPEQQIVGHNLALLYETQGQYAQAEPPYKRSLASSLR